jgi:hypothetical protein
MGASKPPKTTFDHPIVHARHQIDACVARMCLTVSIQALMQTYATLPRLFTVRLRFVSKDESLPLRMHAEHFLTLRFVRPNQFSIQRPQHRVTLVGIDRGVRQKQSARRPHVGYEK